MLAEKPAQRARPRRRCIVIGCMSGNKGLDSLVNEKSEKVQQDQAGYIKKRQEEGEILGQRLGQNAPGGPTTWDTLEPTWHKMLSSSNLRWRDNKPSWATMVTDIRSFFHRVKKAGAKAVTVCIRSLDGLVVEIESIFDFVTMITKDRGLKLLPIWQIYKYDADSWYPRMIPYRGLGSVMSFTGEELMIYARAKDDPTGDIILLIDCLNKLKNKKKDTSKGLQNHNMFPSSDMTGAINVGAGNIKKE